MTTITEAAPEAKVVEGSNGLLLEIDGQIVPNYDATFSPFEEGEVVTGIVVRIDNDEVLVDIGYKSEGVIPSNELSIRKAVDPHDEVEMGEEVDALVLTKEDQDGRLIMSKKRARFEKAWRRIEAAAESGEPVEGTVIEVVKGGLIIDLGVRGFLPASLVDIRRVPNLDEYMGTKIECKVIELNRARNNVVLSRRAVLEEERKEQRQEILDRLQPGLIVEGQISNIVDFGAFVDLNGIDGLIHISELSWSHVNHPSEILSIGDTVAVKVLDIDRDRQRISLGLKQTQEDPWQRVVDTYNVGDELEGTVTKVVTFGAFVEILDGVEGLVHISELAPHHVENPREIVSPGDDVKVKILEIDSERRRLSLSVKRVEGQVLTPKVLPPEELEAGAGDLDDLPELGLSEDVFADGGLASPPVVPDELAEPGAQEAEDAEALVAEVATEEEAVAEVATEDVDAAEPVAEAEPAAEEPAAEGEPAAEQPAAEGEAAEPAAEAEPTGEAEAEPVAEAEPAAEPVADAEPEAEPVAAEGADDPA
jgi:small subunit ribosomal protein S1